MRIEIRELIDVLGKELAHSDDEMQSRFLNYFANELTINCGRNGGFDSQLCYLSDKLNGNGQRMILALASYIQLRTDNKV